jgi:FkbM family methyltransferase
MAGPRLLKAFADTHAHAAFVEIGANDGDQHDFLKPYMVDRAWRGVIVEPVPYVFQRLASTYGDQPGLTLENVAIATADGSRPFYHLAEAKDWAQQGLPQWYDGIGSFSRAEVASHERHIPDIESRIVVAEVPCLTFESLCARNGLERLDLVLIDTEGFDWEIVRQIDLERLRPRLLVYEHYHLGPGEREACRAHLRRAGYEVMEEHFDTFCLDASPDDGLTRLWRELEPAVPGVAAYEEAS